MYTKEENDKQLKKMYHNLKLMRQSREWSLEELSRVSGINKKILTKIENGKDFDIQYLIKLCRIYRIAPHEIFS